MSACNERRFGAEAFVGGSASIVDLTGRTIAKVNITAAEQTIETSFKGIGILTLQNGGETETHKIVVR